MKLVGLVVSACLVCVMSRRGGGRNRNGVAGSFCGVQGDTTVECPTGFTCYDNPEDDCYTDCGDESCPGVCVRDGGSLEFCGGIAGIECESTKEICVDAPGDECDTGCGADCSGACVKKFTVKDYSGQKCDVADESSCPGGYTCYDDPRDTCSEDCGDTDCPGMCVKDGGSLTTCDGIAALQCEVDGEECLHLDNDGCDLNCDGADCGGVCVPELPARRRKRGSRGN